MQNETPQQIAKELAKHDDLIEYYVLVREVKLVLGVDDSHFTQAVRVKVYTNMPTVITPYYYEVSHTIHTPAQAMPNVSSRSGADSVTGAIAAALSLLTSSMKEAVRLGHTPSADWFIRNEDF